MRTTFNANRGSFPDTLQGNYQRDGVLWHSEDLNKQAVKYVRQNTVVKGKPNLTAGSFCQWINECLLVMHTLEPGYPRRVSVETARKWLLELGFTVMDHKKGTYVDGHERPDVVEYRKTFLRRLCALGFLSDTYTVLVMAVLHNLRHFYNLGAVHTYSWHGTSPNAHTMAQQSYS